MIKCDYCNKPAVRNYQKIWVSFFIRNKEREEYSKNPRPEYDVQEPNGEENVHVCEKCEERWLNNEL